MIDLGENFLAIVGGYISDLFSNLSPLIFLILGLAIAFWIIDYIFDTFVRKKEE